jgi:hypothetical protein
VEEYDRRTVAEGKLLLAQLTALATKAGSPGPAIDNSNVAQDCGQLPELQPQHVRTAVPVNAESTYDVLTDTYNSPENTAHQHWQITGNYLRYTFSATDNDDRQPCGKTASPKDFYYFQFGSNGVNDAPECSDRGMCDYSTGVCKCFKAYSGIDCASQSALSGGPPGRRHTLTPGRCLSNKLASHDNTFWE